MMLHPRLRLLEADMGVHTGHLPTILPATAITMFLRVLQVGIVDHLPVTTGTHDMPKAELAPLVVTTGDRSIDDCVIATMLRI